MEGLRPVVVRGGNDATTSTVILCFCMETENDASFFLSIPSFCCCFESRDPTLYRQL